MIYYFINSIFVERNFHKVKNSESKSYFKLLTIQLLYVLILSAHIKSLFEDTYDLA